MSATVLKRRAWVEHIMGMPISLHVRGHSTDVDSVVAKVFAELRRADEVFSPYKVDSQLNRWERGELALHDADPAMVEVFALCREAKQRTDGYFDAACLPRFDPSGLVKGWAVQRAARHLRALGDGFGWCLNAGGDVLVHAPDGQPDWRVGIEDPRDPKRVMRVVTVRSGGIATSGTAHRGTHIINPHNGKPAAGVISVTVIGPSLLWADVYATAAIARGPSDLDWLNSLAGYEAIGMDPR